VRITKRDVTILRDMALAHALTRDQLIRLGYFGSVTRANTRLRELMAVGLVRRLSTPFFHQSIYCVTKQASEVVGERISPLVRGRSASPRFLQHALMVTESRLALTETQGGTWYFEQQLWRKLSDGSGREVRPDGLVLSSVASLVEVDLGHVAPTKFREKLLAYQELALTGQCADLYGFDRFSLLTLTTGKTRARHLNRLTPSDAGFDHQVLTFADIGVALSDPWS
jgi:hypothetical protein